MTFPIDEFSLFTNQSHRLYKAALIFALVRCIISWILNFIKSDSDTDTNSAANSISAQMIRDSLEVTTYGDLELEAWSSAAAAAAGDEFCAVCLNRLEEKDSVKRLRCCHVFHADCIDKWIEFDNEHVTCPLCRAALVGPNGLQFGVVQSETSWAVERMLYILGDENY